MSITMKSLDLTEKALHLEAKADINDLLVEKLWHDLNGQVSREKIARSITQTAERFRDASVTAFVPIFIERFALEQLKGQLKEKS